MKNQWPHGGSSPFRSEKYTGWEEAVRVPSLISWPGQIRAGTNFTWLFSAEDWLVTLVAAAGRDPGLRENAKKGVTANGKTFKVHLDEYNQIGYLTGTSARSEYFYFSDEGDLLAYRDRRFEFHFEIQRATGMNVWRMPLTTLRALIVIDLKSDPYEYPWDGSAYWEQVEVKHSYLALPAVAKVGEYLYSYREFPPRQRPPRSPLIR